MLNRHGSDQQTPEINTRRTNGYTSSLVTSGSAGLPKPWPG
jgi:hypothetical protein